MQVSQNYWLSIWSEQTLSWQGARDEVEAAEESSVKGHGSGLSVSEFPTHFYMAVYFGLGLSSLVFQGCRAVVLVLSTLQASQVCFCPRVMQRMTTGGGTTAGAGVLKPLPLQAAPTPNLSRFRHPIVIGHCLSLLHGHPGGICDVRPGLPGPKESISIQAMWTLSITPSTALHIALHAAQPPIPDLQCPLIIIIIISAGSFRPQSSSVDPVAPPMHT